MLPLRRFFICALFACCIASVSAQEVISSSGSSYNQAGLQIDFTLGQLIQATHASGGIIVTQGLHQTFAGQEEALNTPEQLKIIAYPNPTQDLVTISVPSDDWLTYRVFNLNGQLIISGNFQKNQSIDLSRQAKGAYQLLVTNEKEQLVQAFKIQLQ